MEFQSNLHGNFNLEKCSCFIIILYVNTTFLPYVRLFLRLNVGLRYSLQSFLSIFICGLVDIIIQWILWFYLWMVYIIVDYLTCFNWVSLKAQHLYDQYMSVRSYVLCQSVMSQ